MRNKKMTISNRSPDMVISHFRHLLDACLIDSIVSIHVGLKTILHFFCFFIPYRKINSCNLGTVGSSVLFLKMGSCFHNMLKA